MKKKWTISQADKLFGLPFFELIFQAQQTHRIYFNPQSIQVSTLLSIKTGNCPEDCKYCSQSARYRTELKTKKLLEIKEIVDSAKQAKKIGATRFCMGAAWKNPHDRDIPYLRKIIRKVKSLGLETCMTLGSLSENQARSLSEAGLDYYNHNLDTSEEFYEKIVTTRKYHERLETIEKVQKAGIKVCSGGILGLGEGTKDRASLLVQLANLPKTPESVPINMLVKIKGTPFFDKEDIDFFDFVRTIAVARIMLPQSFIRLSAGRKNMNEQMQTLCFMAGANSVFSGCKLLTTDNPDEKEDRALFKKLDIDVMRIDDLNNLSHDKSLSSKEKLRFEDFYDAYS